MKKCIQPDEKEYSTGSIMGLTKEDLVVISIALIAAATLFIYLLIK